MPRRITIPSPSRDNDHWEADMMSKLLAVGTFRENMQHRQETSICFHKLDIKKLQNFQ